MTCNETCCPGFSVTGNVPPEMEKPLPESLTEFTVRAAFPLEVMVSVCVDGCPTVTLPKSMDVGLTTICAVAASSCSEKVLLTPPALAVKVTVCVEVTDEAVAVRFAVVAPDGTVTEAGTETELLLLDSATDIPPEPAAALRVTAHVSETAPVSELLVQFRLLRVTAVAVGSTCRDRVLLTPPAEAVIVAVCVVVTVPAVAVKLAFVEPAGTVTDAGTDSALLLLLLNETASPPVPAAALRVTEQESVPPLVKEPLVQLRPLRAALEVAFFPCPLSFTCVDFPCDVSLVRVNVPDEVAVEEGAYAICRVVDWLGSRVRGKLVFPASVKPCPAIVALVSVDAVELVFVIWTCCVPVSPITTPPKLTVAGLATMGEAVPELTWGAPQPATTIRSELNARSSQALWSATTRLKVFLMPGLYGREG